MTEKIPNIIFGTSGLGNLYKELPFEVKVEILKACIDASEGEIVFDSAGKYGAGLALESIAKGLRQLKVDPERVSISNKLAWYRVPLTSKEPTFEPGVWKNIHHDAVQKISYDGIMECYTQGNTLLGEYKPNMVSVHDPDEYLAAAMDEEDREKRLADIYAAYDALFDLKKSGKVKSIGIGAKNWKSIAELSEKVDFDWIMIANSLTIKSHPEDLLKFLKSLHEKDVKVINSAVFHGGYLLGGDFFDYNYVDPEDPKNTDLVQWRKSFFRICDEYSISPFQACTQFSKSMPLISSLAINTTDPTRVLRNVQLSQKKVPNDFWQALHEERLIEPYVLQYLIKEVNASIL
ncbi:MAG: aldo/keto reductase [Saprospiraceae bacterium]|nr:aldo/keto reductase [Saprospiraceae bacterium]